MGLFFSGLVLGAIFGFFVGAIMAGNRSARDEAERIERRRKWSGNS